jgi:hypothetical protein
VLKVLSVAMLVGAIAVAASLVLSSVSVAEEMKECVVLAKSHGSTTKAQCCSFASKPGGGYFSGTWGGSTLSCP